MTIGVGLGARRFAVRALGGNVCAEKRGSYAYGGWPIVVDLRRSVCKYVVLHGVDA